MKEKRENMKIKEYKLKTGWIFALFLLILILSFFYVNHVKNLIYKNVYTYIDELGKQTATQLNLSIKDQMNFVEMMVDSIDRGDFNTPEAIFEGFEEKLENYHFTRLVILDKNGNGTTSDGHVVKDYANIQEFFNQDEVYLSENRPSTVSDNQVNIYSKTFELDGEELVLMATINTEDYKKILLRRLFGIGGTYLINNNGDILIDAFDTVQEANTNLYDYMIKEYKLKWQKDRDKVLRMGQSIKNKETGTFDIELKKNTYFVHYEKVNINDWYVVTVASDETIAKELISLVALSVILCLSLCFVTILISLYIDKSNQKKNRKLYKVAYIDPITLLGNESYFRENGSEYLQNQEKNKYIIALDINKFKALNNVYGYEFCNNVLKEIGNKLVNILPSDNITCRISNDVFVTIFSYKRNIHNLLNKIFNEVSNLKVDDTNIHVNLSIGVYKTNEKDKDINKIIDKAYIAHAKIKGLYNQNYYIFDETLENQLVEEQKIESCMEEALKNKEFKVVYQPKIYTDTEKLSGAEALVRWQRNGEVIPPNKFIPLFEKNKFIIKLDLYVFEQACKDIASWKDKFNFQPTVSINVSKEHFVDENFIDEYVKIADKYNIDKSKIDLEITESATIDENIDTLKIFNNIKQKGFDISIDDFGTGYSSLSMLENMPIDVIKIDKVFVDKADLNSNRNIINYIMLLAKRLGVKTIVEGVETKEQIEFVRKLKCDVVQGYYYSKPISKEDFEEYIIKDK